MTAITTRTNLVVPVNMVSDLTIPPLAITDASPNPEWGEVPISPWAYVRNPSQRLPLDPRTAKATRRYRRLAPWALPVNLIALGIFLIAIYMDGLPIALKLGGIGLYMTTMLVWQRVVAGLPSQQPRRLRSGDLHIPKVPVEVAEQWIIRNPGVTANDEPMPRPHSRRYYVSWSIGLVTAAILLVVVLANDGREDPILLWMLAPVLFITGLAMALKILPPAQSQPKYTLFG